VTGDARHRLGSVGQRILDGRERGHVVKLRGGVLRRSGHSRWRREDPAAYR
jgi:hypothetical protein